MLLAVALVVTAELLARYAAEHATRRSQALQSPAPSGADMSSVQLFSHSCIEGAASFWVADALSVLRATRHPAVAVSWGPASSLGLNAARWRGRTSLPRAGLRAASGRRLSPEQTFSPDARCGRLGDQRGSAESG